MLEVLIMGTMGTEVLWIRDGRAVALLAAPAASRHGVGGDRPPVIVRGIAHALILRARATNPSSAAGILLGSFVEKQPEPLVPTRLVAECAQILKVENDKARKLDPLPTV